jgi:hypothetical protein
VKIHDIFRRPIGRTIEEVIKVDLVDEEIVALELDEYVATENILESLEEVLDAYQETILKPSEQTNVWVSGFFGSGKSLFAKVLGNLLSNPTILGRRAVERFGERVDSPRISALLNTVHAQAPTLATFVDLSTGRNVAREGESVVLPVYRALLERLGYSRNLILAELEFDLEGDGVLGEFVRHFSSIEGRSWVERRNVGLAKGEASHAMHLLRPETYPQVDSWARQATEPEINANWFALRAMELLARRGDGATRLAFVVDEVGQYVARSVDRMLDLQGLAEAVQKHRGQLWLIVTSQEKLSDVVDSLESRQIELARVQARFPLRVDLLPSDIDEVTGKRVLDKNDAGQQAVRAALASARHKLAANVRLSSPTRASDLAEDEFVRLYPMLPYQVQLLIDAVSARRAQGGATPMLGGSNRTIIKLAQQLVVNPKVGLGGDEVGALVTIDRAYDLLEAIIPTAWQSEVTQVAEKYGDSSLEARLMKAIALVVDVPALPLRTENLAVLLHPSVSSESLRDEVVAAVERLVRDDRLRQSDDGYRLQSPEQKDWEKTRRSIDPRPADAVRIRRAVLRERLAGLSVTAGRAFKVEVHVEGEKVLDGDIPLHIDEADAARRTDLRAASRDPNAAATIWWTFTESPDTYEAIVELFRSQQMIARRDVPTKTPADVELIGEERARLARCERQVAERLGRDLLAGQAIFRGQLDDVEGTDLRGAAQAIVASRLGEIYSQLGQFSVSLRGTDVLAVLQADDLRGLPTTLSEEGIGVTRVTPSGVELASDTGPLATLLNEVRGRANYGNEATGAHLERRFGAPPYGAPVEVVQALVAAGIRGGLINVVHQGSRISRADDPRLERVFRTLPAFRAASFIPPSDVGPDLPTRTALAEKLGALTGTRPAVAVESLAEAVRERFLGETEVVSRVVASLRGLGLPVPEPVTRTADILERLRGGTDSEVVSTAAQTWTDLVSGSEAVSRLARVLDDDLETVRRAKREIDLGSAGLGGELLDELDELGDLLASGDLPGHIARIRAISARLDDARRKAREAALSELRRRVQDETKGLRERFANVDQATLSEALTGVAGLVPSDGEADAVPIGVLTANLSAVEARVAQASAVLEEIQAAGNLARIDIGSLVGEPITSEEDLEIALGRIRDAVSAELAAGKQVRIR